MCTSVGISASQLSWLRRRSSCDNRFPSPNSFLSQTRAAALLSPSSSSSVTFSPSGKQWESSLRLLRGSHRSFVTTTRVVRLAACQAAAAGEMDAGSGSDSSSIVEGNGTAELLRKTGEEEEEEEGDWSSRAAAQRKVRKDAASMREKIASFAEKQSKYFWLGGPIVITTAVVLPSAMVSLVAQLQKNFVLGVATAFGFDVLFVLAADAFFVLTDKTGHHQRVSSSTEGPPPWIGPWEYTGYPEGEPALSKAVSFAGVAIAVATLVLSVLIGKLGVALPALGPYLALIFAQVAYERLMSNDRLPVYPLVPIVYTLYRFRQLARGMELVAAMGGDWFLTTMMQVLMVVWTFYLGVHLAQLPWLYSTWNSNRAT